MDFNKIGECVESMITTKYRGNENNDPFESMPIKKAKDNVDEAVSIFNALETDKLHVEVMIVKQEINRKISRVYVFKKKSMCKLS